MTSITDHPVLKEMFAYGSKNEGQTMLAFNTYIQFCEGKYIMWNVEHKFLTPLDLIVITTGEENNSNVEVHLPISSSFEISPEWMDNVNKEVISLMGVDKVQLILCDGDSKGVGYTIQAGLASMTDSDNLSNKQLTFLKDEMFKKYESDIRKTVKGDHSPESTNQNTNNKTETNEKGEKSSMQEDRFKIAEQHEKNVQNVNNQVDANENSESPNNSTKQKDICNQDKEKNENRPSTNPIARLQRENIGNMVNSTCNKEEKNKNSKTECLDERKENTSSDIKRKIDVLNKNGESIKESAQNKNGEHKNSDGQSKKYEEKLQICNKRKDKSETHKKENEKDRKSEAKDANLKTKEKETGQVGSKQYQKPERTKSKECTERLDHSSNIKAERMSCKDNDKNTTKNASTDKKPKISATKIAEKLLKTVTKKSKSAKDDTIETIISDDDDELTVIGVTCHNRMIPMRQIPSVGEVVDILSSSDEEDKGHLDCSDDDSSIEDEEEIDSDVIPLSTSEEEEDKEENMNELHALAHRMMSFKGNASTNSKSNVDRKRKGSSDESSDSDIEEIEVLPYERASKPKQWNEIPKKKKKTDDLEVLYEVDDRKSLFASQVVEVVYNDSVEANVPLLGHCTMEEEEEDDDDYSDEDGVEILSEPGRQRKKKEKIKYQIEIEEGPDGKMNKIKRVEARTFALAVQKPAESSGKPDQCVSKNEKEENVQTNSTSEEDENNPSTSKTNKGSVIQTTQVDKESVKGQIPSTGQEDQTTTSEEEKAGQSTSKSQEEKLDQITSTCQEVKLGQTSSTSQEVKLGQTSSTSQEEKLGQTSSTSQEEKLGQTSSTSQEVKLGQTSSTSQEEKLGQTSSTSQEEKLGQTSSTSQEEKLGQTSSTSQEEKLGQTSSPSQEVKLGQTSSTSQRKKLGQTSSTSQEVKLGQTSSTSQEEKLGQTSSTSQEEKLGQTFSTSQEENLGQTSSSSQESNNGHTTSKSQEHENSQTSMSPECKTTQAVEA